MKTLWAAPILLALAACTQATQPQYMQDMPKTDEDVRKITDGIKKELGEGFTVERVNDVFFVAANASSRKLEQCAGTIKRMYEYLYRDYFQRKPDKPILVYLFRDKESYEKYCKAAYDHPPSTPFGFYMSSERKMVMNIDTGTGTLAHELVHPLLAEDFENVPSWFNEGFASLYEQSTTKEGRMVGLVNWRLPGLHKAIREDRAVRLKSLLNTDSVRFYGDERGVNYATARYLCLYLQEKGLLRDMYARFKKGYKEDPTGLAALQAVTGQKVDVFEKEWREWVMTLQYPDD